MKIMKVLVFSGCNDFNALEIARENIEKGNEVFILKCDKSLGICQHNHKGNPFMCKLCTISMKQNMEKLHLLKDIHLFNLYNVVDTRNDCWPDGLKRDFNSIQELKDLNYKGAQLGYGAFSSYVTFSRNVMPEINDSFKKYIYYYIKKECIVYDSLEILHHEYCFDQIIFHNGRFAQYKPFLEFAKIHNVDFIATEQKYVDDLILKDYFHNDIPHALDYLAKNVLINWEKGDLNNREEIGRSFYERRKKGIPAGDKVYVKGQHEGELPEGWEDNVENISIFNSSEDEFCAVSKEYDNNLLFPNQYVALKTIFEHYKGDKTKHFYVRIHPNLKKVPFKSHLALHELKYDNVTIIPADSTISSYTLMDYSDKIIIFDSTMGVEAAYWGKPVIALTKYIYWKLGMLHNPSSSEELWKLIDNKHLMSEDNDNLLKYGYWLLHPNYPRLEHVRYEHVSFKFLSRQFNEYTIMKLLGSGKLFVLAEFLLDKVPLFSKFKRIPCTKPYSINKV